MGFNSAFKGLKLCIVKFVMPKGDFLGPVPVCVSIPTYYSTYISATDQSKASSVINTTVM